MSDTARLLHQGIASLLDAEWGGGLNAGQRTAAAAEAAVLAEAAAALRPLLGAQDGPDGLARAIGPG